MTKTMFAFCVAAWAWAQEGDTRADACLTDPDIDADRRERQTEITD
ncbi:MAG: hypothetical protein JO323_10570 [Acidobacteriia bacterium]|nr:hypothetical protein [Terriglobia bacterium]